MTQTSGFYCNGPVRLTVNHSGTIMLGGQGTRLRADRHFWLALDDGQIGRYGEPQQVKLDVNGRLTTLYVEQRGKDHFGLIPATEEGQYSNSFLSRDGTVHSTYGPEEQWTITF